MLKIKDRYKLELQRSETMKLSQQTFVGLEDVFETCLEDVLKTYLKDVLKTCLEDVFKTYLEDFLKILWRQTKYLLGISAYLSGDNKSKCVSNKSVFHKSLSDNSNANPKCIN